MHLMSTTSSNSNTSGSSLSGSTGGGKSTPPARHSSRHRTRNTPHGPLTLHKIARIKMLDRHSCYVAGIQREIATKEILSKPAFFGQFGEISSIRVLRDRDPGEVYLVRFEYHFTYIYCVHLLFEMDMGRVPLCLWFFNNGPFQFSPLTIFSPFQQSHPTALILMELTHLPLCWLAFPFREGRDSCHCLV